MNSVLNCRWMITLSAFAVMVAGTGCADSGSPPKGVPVSGLITLDGKPLDGANVTFVNGTFAGYARTNAEGKYRLVQGALPGMNKIVISKYVGGPEPGDVSEAVDGIDAMQLEAAAMGLGKAIPQPKNLVPPEYGDADKSKLTFEVPSDGADDVDFSI